MSKQAIVAQIGSTENAGSVLFSCHVHSWRKLQVPAGVPGTKLL
jgi:hypothetical protein